MPSVYGKKEKRKGSGKIFGALKNPDSISSKMISYLQSPVNSLPMYAELFMRLYLGF